VFQPAQPFDAATVWTCLPCWDDDDDDEITYFSFILDGWKIRCLGYWYYIYIPRSPAISWHAVAGIKLNVCWLKKKRASDS